MRRTYHKEIAEIPYPEEHLEDLKRAGPLMVEATERDGLPIETGTINLGKVDDDLDLALFFFYWIADCNQVIEHLNMVLADMRALPTRYVLLDGPPKARFYLLVRTFFYEFYRFREIHHQVVKAASARGYIGRKEVPNIRKVFHDAFATAIELRNVLVHGSPIWKGQQHFDLTLVGSAWERGMVLQDSKTGEIWDIGEVLNDICNSTANDLAEEGNRMSLSLKHLVHIYVDIVSKV